MTEQKNADQAAEQDPQSDEYVNAVIRQHGYDSPETVIARLWQWIGLNGGENCVTLLMCEAHKALSKLRAEGVQAGEPLANTVVRQCPRCTGNGTVLRLSGNGPDAYDVQEECSHCEGSGVVASAPVAGEAQPVAEVVSRYGDPEAFGERDLKVLVDLNSYPYGAKFYAAPQASEAVRNAIKDCGSKVIKALAAIAMADGPDARKADAPELIYRSPVMDEVARIRQAYDELESAIKAQASKDGAQPPANRPESRASIESKGGAMDGRDCAKGAGDGQQKYWLCCGSKDPNHPNRRAPDCFNADRAKWGTADQHSVFKQSLTATQTGEKGESDAG